MTTINTSQDQTGLAHSQRASQDLHAKANSINNLQSRLIPQEDKDKKLREACEGFETIFVKKMWEEMQATIQESDFLKGKDEKHWRSMYNQALAEDLSKAGGIGLADMMYRQLSGNLADATRATVATSFGDNKVGFELKPVPLFNSTDVGQPQKIATSTTIPVQNMSNIYEKEPSNISPQNTRSVYLTEDTQPKGPNMEAVRNQSIKNANAAIANMGLKPSDNANADFDNSKTVQNVLEQLKNNNRNNAQIANGQTANSQATNSQMQQGQNNMPNLMSSPNGGTENHVLQPGLNAQPARVNAYTQPLVHKVGAGAVLPNNPAYAQAVNKTKTKLPEQAGLNQAQVHGNPGISPSRYVHNSPFVVQAQEKNASSDSNAQNIQKEQGVQKASLSQNQSYIPITAQNSHMGAGQNAMLRQDLNVLPSERKSNKI